MSIEKKVVQTEYKNEKFSALLDEKHGFSLQLVDRRLGNGRDFGSFEQMDEKDVQSLFELLQEVKV